ncbi:hypothetical protein Pcinc_031998 [Petrolisthes cinctipes]|uniref:Uncharacterized protein n=1 Tax=Petrolisthes cinctipes TaxID=88211 RepID=A0AAE1EV81_PETCI|nr:hypothetical protein Pcinc_031998 [Petrolisthes cinctipes]
MLECKDNPVFVRPGTPLARPSSPPLPRQRSPPQGDCDTEEGHCRYRRQDLQPAHATTAPHHPDASLPPSQPS